MAALDELWTPQGGGDQVALIDTIEDPAAADPEFSLEQTELNEALAEAIARLPEREKLVVTLYYYEELTLREIGEVLGVTESRVSQLHTKAVLRLKARLSGGPSAPPPRRRRALARDFDGERPVRRAVDVDLDTDRPLPVGGVREHDHLARVDLGLAARCRRRARPSPCRPTGRAATCRPSTARAARPRGRRTARARHPRSPSTREIASQRGARATTTVTVEPSGTARPARRDAEERPGLDRRARPLLDDRA